QVDLASIAVRERITRHDVKARIEEFAALAGHEHVHKGMTSRDLTENVEQLQIRLSLEHVRDRTVALLARLARPPAEHAALGGVAPPPPRRERRTTANPAFPPTPTAPAPPRSPPAWPAARPSTPSW